MASSQPAAHPYRRRQPTSHQQPPIPSFYENLNGQWVLSDNWNLYGLSGSNQRHRARSLDEAPNLAQSNSSSSTSTLIHHSSAVSSPPALQYDVLPPTNASSNTNNQKLYLPAGWNHTSKRGPLYATSVIIIASLLTAIAVLSTVICLVARRRARGKRRAMLKEGLPSPSDPKFSPSEIEEGRGITTGRRSRLKNQIKHKLKQLTIVKINHSPNGKQLARFSRIKVHPGQPGDPQPPSLIIVKEARRSNSYASHSSFRCNGESAGSSRRRTRSHRTESQSDESPASEPQYHQTVTVNGLLGVPSPLRPSNASTFTPASPLPAQIIADSGSSLAGPSEPLIRPIESEAELASRHEEPVPINTYPNSTPETPRSTTSGRTLSYRTAQSGQRPVLFVDTTGALCATSQTHHQEAGRASVTPNYRSCREIIRARSSTFSSHHATRPPGSLTTPASLPDLHFNFPPLPNESFQAQNLPHPTTRRRTRSIEPSTISGTVHDPPVESTVASLAVAEPLPPAYSGRATPGVGESSRTFEKQRIIDPLEDQDDARQQAEFLEDDPHQSIPDPHYQEALNGPFVAHVATDDKLVLRSLLRMGSTPAMGSRPMGEKEEMSLGLGREEEEELQGGDGSRRTRVEEGVGWTGSSGGGIVEASSGLAPSAPPLVHQEDEEDAAYDDFSGKRRSGPLEEPLVQEGVGALDDEQVGGSASSLAILPAPPAQFIIRFDPSTSLVDHNQPPFSHQPPHPDNHHPRQVDVVASAPPLNLRLSQSSSRHSSLSLSLPNLPSSSSSSSSHPLHTNHNDELNITASIAPPYVE